MAVVEQLPLRAPFDLNFSWLQLSTTHTSTSQTTEPNLEGNLINRAEQVSLQELLPAACLNKKKYTFYKPTGGIDWLSEQFNLRRLEDVEAYLWLAGRPVPPRPLLYQKSAGREILVTHEMDMHLLRGPNSLYLRPIPSYVFSRAFWEAIIDQCDTRCESITEWMESKGAGDKTLSQNNKSCKHRKLHASVMGFLHSYIALVPNDIDFDIAHKAGLLPCEMSWTDWKLFVSEFLATNQHNLKHVHRRFFYGELRLGRLNKIYKFTFRSHRGYRYEYQRYGDLISRYLGSIAVFTGYIVVALAAMQVGLSNKFLVKNEAFQSAAYQFTIFSIVGPLGLLAMVGMIVVFLVLANLRETRRCLHERQQEWNYPD